MALTEDFSVFFDTDHFAQVVLIGAEGDETAVNAIFDNPYYLLEGPEFGATTSQPKFRCAQADYDAAGGAQGTRVVVAGTVYTIKEAQPDGTGVVDVTLFEAD